MEYYNKMLEEIEVPGLKHPIFMRKETSDLGVFKQVFYQYEYVINLKDSPKVILDIGSNIGLSAVYFVEILD